MRSGARANLCALGAISLWATLATLSVELAHVPPFLLTGLALVIGGLTSVPVIRFDLGSWRVPVPTLILGLYGLFGYHFLLFIALRHAPPVEANLVNYLWPLLIVVLAPLILPDLGFRSAHLLAALLGFVGAALAIVGGKELGGFEWGYLPALGAAVIWSTYSLLTRRVVPFPTSAIGGFCTLAGGLSLLTSFLVEDPLSLSASDWMLIALMGIGPLGAAFFLWDRALKTADPRTIAVFAFATPLLSTSLLLAVRGEAPTIWIAASATPIVSAAVIATRSS